MPVLLMIMTLHLIKQSCFAPPSEPLAAVERERERENSCYKSKLTENTGAIRLWRVNSSTFNVISSFFNKWVSPKKFLFFPFNKTLSLCRERISSFNKAILLNPKWVSLSREGFLLEQKWFLFFKERFSPCNEVACQEENDFQKGEKDSAQGEIYFLRSKNVCRQGNIHFRFTKIHSVFSPFHFFRSTFSFPVSNLQLIIRSIFFFTWNFLTFN